MTTRGLTLSEKRAAVRALALVAWSDRVLTPAEKKLVAARAIAFTGLSADDVVRSLDDGKNLLRYGADVPDALRALGRIPTTTGLELLRHCYDVAAVDRHLPDPELGVIERIASVFVPRHRVVHVVRWLRARRELMKLEGELTTGEPGAAAKPAKPRKAAKPKAAKQAKAAKPKAAAKPRRGVATKRRAKR